MYMDINYFLYSYLNALQCRGLHLCMPIQLYWIVMNLFEIIGYYIIRSHKVSKRWSLCSYCSMTVKLHDDVIKWKHFPCYWPFVRGIHRSPVNSPHKGKWRGALMFSLIWAGDLRRHQAHCDVIVMIRRAFRQQRGAWRHCKRYDDSN